MTRAKKINILKLIFLIVVIILFAGLTIYLFPVMRELNTLEGQLAFKEKVGESGPLGMLVLFGLQFLQIFLIIVPGEPIEVLAGMFYGGIWGTIFITISAGIISTFIFMLVRKFGRKFVYDFCSEEKIKKLESKEIFKNTKKLEYILLILFLIPGTPKDLFAYLSGLLPIKPLRFIAISVFGRLPSVISSTYAGQTLAVGDWKKSIIIYGITYLVVGIIIFIMNKFDKSKLTEEILKDNNIGS